MVPQGIQASLLLPLKLVTKLLLVSVDTDWALTQQLGITFPSPSPVGGRLLRIINTVCIIYVHSNPPPLH